MKIVYLPKIYISIHSQADMNDVWWDLTPSLMSEELGISNAIFAFLKNY